jgi:hypothetical protein
MAWLSIVNHQVNSTSRRTSQPAFDNFGCGLNLNAIAGASEDAGCRSCSHERNKSKSKLAKEKDADSMLRTAISRWRDGSKHTTARYGFSLCSSWGSGTLSAVCSSLRSVHTDRRIVSFTLEQPLMPQVFSFIGLLILHQHMTRCPSKSIVSCELLVRLLAHLQYWPLIMA